MKFKDYYDSLGVARDASADEIRRAYRRLARKYHPDVSKEPEAEARFKEMKEAYEVLKDPEKRAAYDQFGENWQAGQPFEPPPNWGEEQAFRHASGDPRGFSDFFEELFGARRGPQTGPGGFGNLRYPGDDVNARIEISVEDAYRGATRQLSLEVPGLDEQGQVVRQRRTLNVRIPKGVRAGQRIRLEDQGGAGIGGAPSGDLYLEVAFAPHPLYTVRGRDVYMTLPVSPSEAVLGRTVKAPTLGGVVDLRIPAGSNTGKSLRLKGRGLPGNPPGDMYVELEVVVPTRVDDSARALYEKLEREHPFDPRERIEVSS